MRYHRCRHGRNALRRGVLHRPAPLAVPRSAIRCCRRRQWAEPYGACKDSHILRIGDTYYIYYIVTARIGYSAIALATTTDWDHFELAPEPVFLFPAGLRGTGGCESPCVLERDGVFHLFFCNGPGTWHTISDRPDRFPGTNGIYLVGPFVAAEVFRWNGRWWLSSTRKEDLRRKDRLRGISHHGDVDDERRKPGRHVRRRGHLGRRLPSAQPSATVSTEMFTIEVEQSRTNAG